MSEIEIFNFLKDNLRIEADDRAERDYGKEYTSITVSLYLTNPDTGKEERISSGSFTISGWGH